MEKIKVFMPLIEKLVWPFFVIVGLLVYQDEVRGLYNEVTEDGRAMKLGGFFEIGEKIQNTEIQTFATQDLSIEAVEEDFQIATKEGGAQLQRIKNNIESANLKKIDALKITNNKIYLKTLLLDYISNLGVKYILFENEGRFEGWMNSSIFSGQLLEMEDGSQFSYGQLKTDFVGFQNEQIQPKTKTSEVLQIMTNKGLEDIAVVQDNSFKYMVNKQTIINKLVTNALLTLPESEK